MDAHISTAIIVTIVAVIVVALLALDTMLPPQNTGGNYDTREPPDGR